MEKYLKEIINLGSDPNFKEVFDNTCSMPLFFSWVLMRGNNTSWYHKISTQHNQPQHNNTVNNIWSINSININQGGVVTMTRYTNRIRNSIRHYRYEIKYNESSKKKEIAFEDYDLSTNCKVSQGYL
ncbi:hypothetical protein Fleli_4027 [Bernardetia litoralis DSM 6794]|uniref:Uncharacterized protein n=1 Tax=Bernardetia litoralis (strain ATCC 23117 / DSM 6794 / NBRC 15988 / NCIMB 1366 / Fx l1 / Sio-4) TaxID=880071 RepID=I4AQU2_BERLS|nr:hypothetical protein [Bernardetia litoralis]AFM06327.1 hypothetical protein Fleli_4027 [Bernardetia litoralis DSM 6794]